MSLALAASIADWIVGKSFGTVIWEAGRLANWLHPSGPLIRQPVSQLVT